MLSQTAPIYRHQKEKLLHSRIQQIRSELPLLLGSDRSFNMFYFNAENMIRLLKFVLNPMELSGLRETIIFSEDESEELLKIEQLQQVYTFKEIVYTIITSLFRTQNIQTSQDGQIDVRIGNNIFLQQKSRSSPRLFELIVQTIVSGNQQSLRQYFKLINQQINASTAEMKRNQSFLDLMCEQKQEKTRYSLHLKVKIDSNITVKHINGEKRINFSSFSHFCLALGKEWLSMFGQPIKSLETNDILLILGLAIHLQSKKKYTKNMIASYQELWFYLQVKQSHKQQRSVKILVSFELEKKSLGISLSNFIKNQKEMLNQLKKKNFHQYSYLCLSDNVYQIDSSPIYEKGFKIRNAKICQLQGSVYVDDAHRSYYYSYRQCTIKMISQNRFKKLQSQELKIVNLIKQIQHKQQLIKIAKSLGMDEKRSALLGLNRIVEVIQTINLSQNQREQSYLVFETCSTQLGRYNKQILKQFPKKQLEIFTICRQITEGLTCLHHQMAKYYDFELMHHSGCTLQESSIIGINHYDIKPTNIMINKIENDIKVRLIDFSASIFEREDAAINKIEGKNYYYLSTQTKKDENIENIDLWGLGSILFQMFIEAPLPATINQIQFILKKMENIPTKWKQTIKKLLVESTQIRISSIELLNWFSKNKFYLLMETHETLVSQFVSASKFEILDEGKVRRVPQYQIQAQNIVHAIRYNLQELMLSFSWFDNKEAGMLASASLYLNFNMVPSLFHTIQIALILYSQTIKLSKRMINIVMIYEKNDNSEHLMKLYPIELVEVQNKSEKRNIAAIFRDKTSVYHRWFDSFYYSQGYCFHFEDNTKNILLISPTLLKQQKVGEKILYHIISSTITLLYRQPLSSGIIKVELMLINGFVLEDLRAFLKEIVKIAASLHHLKINYQKKARKEEKRERSQLFGVLQLKDKTVELKVSQQVEKCLGIYAVNLRIKKFPKDFNSQLKQLIKIAYSNNWHCDFELLFNLSISAFVINQNDGKSILNNLTYSRVWLNNNLQKQSSSKNPKLIPRQLKGVISLFHMLIHLNYPALLTKIFMQLIGLIENLLTLICQRMKKVFKLDIAYQIDWEGQIGNEESPLYKLNNLIQKCDQIVKKSELSQVQQLKWKVVVDNYILFSHNIVHLKLLLNL